MPRPDPEQLEREADEMFAQLNQSDQNPQSQEEGQPQQAQQQADSPLPGELNPDEQQSPATVDDQLQQQGEVEDLAAGLTLENAGNRISNAQARMHQAIAREKEATERLPALEAAVTRLEQENAGLRNQLQQIQVAAPQPGAQERATAVLAAQPGESDEDLKRAMDEYGEVIGPLVRKFDALAGQVQTLGNTVGRQSERTSRQEHFDAIARAHSDYQQIHASGDFQGWLIRQPVFIQDYIKKGSADQVIYVLDQYKGAVGVPANGSSGVGNSLVDEARAISTPSGAQSGRTTQPEANKGKVSLAELQAAYPPDVMKELAVTNPEELARVDAELDRLITEGRLVV